MASILYEKIHRECDLIERYSAYYRRQFDQLIDRLNRTPSASDLQSLRLCVEAVDMMLVSQDRLAKVLHELADQDSSAPVKHAA